MYASLAVTTAGLILGFSAVRFWSRQKFKGTAALKRKVDPTRVPIEQKESYRWLENMRQSTELLGEPARCVHVGDRESDIYELFCTAQELGTHSLVRTCVDRLAGDGGHTIADEMQETRLKGMHRIEVRNGQGRIEAALLELRYRRILVLRPVGKQKRYPALTLTVIHAKGRGKPMGQPAIEWKLITDLPVTTRATAIEKLRWYAQRWKIEVFHKTLKSGCRAEEARLRTAERLVRLIAVFYILSWRVFWMTMLRRAAPDAATALILTKAQIRLLDRLVPDKKPSRSGEETLSSCLPKVAQLGGYLAHTKDLPPGNTVMWRGPSPGSWISTWDSCLRHPYRCG